MTRDGFGASRGVRRRELIAGLPAAALMAAAAGPPAGPAFGPETLREMARRLAARPYSWQVADLPPDLAKIGYDAFRDLRYAPDKAVWRAEGLPFQLQMFHRGWLFKDRVDLFQVAGGRATALAYAPDQFSFGRVALQPHPDLGYAGFRIHTRMRPGEYYDEVAAFLGASYFRAVSRDTLYGLSARGLAIGAGEAGEEFPSFRSFWLERPAASAVSLTAYALLDSPSVAGAYRFVVTPGEPTTVEVSASLFPRRTLANAGIAPLTSMYLYGPGQARRFDDFRPQVHDSDSLAVVNGAGERLWRPLENPETIQTSAFLDQGPKGFGLLQRERAFSAYQDLEANYHRRPSLWVTPLEGFGRGDVRLVELPGPDETEDNIATSWRPAEPLAAGREHRFRYRLDWGAQVGPQGPGQVVAWGAARGSLEGRRRFVVDFSDDQMTGAAAEVSASAGSIRDVQVQPNPDLRSLRLSFELETAGAAVSELRAGLSKGGRTISEVWTYRWLG